MPRYSRRSIESPATTPSLFLRASSSIPIPSSHSPQLAELRKQWKWAVVSSFMHTFASLLALNNITLIDIENDLISSTMTALPRFMHRLLYTLTQDRKINLNTWQTSLRKQYMKRDPEANPIGPEPELKSTELGSVSDSGSPPARDVSEQIDQNTVKKEVTAEPELKDDAVEESENASDSVNVSKNDAGLEDNGQTNSLTTVKVNGIALPAEDLQSAESYPESKDWGDLSMLEKLDSVHTVIEWHFQTPLRLRSLMRSDDDYASWRTEPIGFDAKHNTYWLIGVDRLWIQRQLPIARKTNKRKVAPKKKSNTRKDTVNDDLADEVEESTSPKKASKGNTTKRKRCEAFEEVEPIATATRVTRRKQHAQESKTKTDTAQVNSSRVRAAKTQANVKLDEQAKQLAAAQAEMKLISKGRYPREQKTTSPRRLPPTPLGTRVSRRLRGVQHEDEWQQIPEEWLKENTVKSELDDSKDSNTVDQKAAADTAKIMHRRAGLDSSEGSELTELSDTESNEVPHTASAKTLSKSKSSQKAQEQQTHIDSPEEADIVPESLPPADFIEWETICVTLDEWENVLKRFEGSHHYLEKALYAVLSKEIVPNVTSMLREAEIQRQKEEAITHRKRSSRIAIKESEKEEVRRTAQRLAEEEERLARERRLEARAKKEEDERLAREQAREQRRKEREEREERMRLKRERFSESHQNINTASGSTSGAATPPIPRDKNKIGSGTTTPGEDWELDCEICGAKGTNQDDGVPLMSCGKCSKWQHISCHDAADASAGYPKRNWDDIDFTCKQCSNAIISHNRISNGHPNGYRNTTLNGQRNWMNQTIQYQSPPQWYADTRQSSNSRSVNDVRLATYSQSAPLSYVPNNVAYGNMHSPHYHSGIQEGPSPQHTGYPQGSPITFTHYQPDQRGFSPYATSQSSSQSHSYVHQPYYNSRLEQRYTSPKVNTNIHSPASLSSTQPVPLMHHIYSQNHASGHRETQPHVNGANHLTNGGNNPPHGQVTIVESPNSSPLPQGALGSHHTTHSNPSAIAYPYHYQHA